MKEELRKIGGHIRKNHMYYVCALITLALLALGIYQFPNALGRFIESCRDFGTTTAYVFCDIFDIETDMKVTVKDLPDYSFLNVREWLQELFKKPPAPSTAPSTPSTPLPSEWEQFKIKWAAYWQTFADKRTFYLYLYFLFNVIYYVTLLAIYVILPIVLIVPRVFKALYFRESRYEETDEEKQDDMRAIRESIPLKIWHAFYFHVVLPVVAWFLRLYYFIKDHPALWQFWALLVLLYFNVFTIILETLACFYYVAISLDFVAIYRGVYKLFLDLYAFFDFVPIVIILILALVLFDKYAKNIAYDRLYHRERCNRGFTNSLGVVTYVYAEMGGFKTTMLVDMLLSDEVQLRDDALEIILECDACFPNFPWITLERCLKRAYENHEVYDKWSCIRWIKAKREMFLQNPCKENIFGYNFERYPLTYDNKAYVEDIWDTLQDYALAYTIYTVQNSLLVTSFSIRVDSLFMDLGHFPLWNSDFFKRDSRLIDSFSRHSNILDYDMIRLGNQLLENNPNRYAFGWGCWGITEADKEFKNTLELQEVKAKDDECNQKNDLTHVLFKMSRHACMIRGRNFIRIKADMQRIENITANLRGIGMAALVAEREEKRIVLPFFSLYKLLSPFLLSMKARIDGVFLNDRFLRSDKRLITSALEKIRSAIGKWQDRNEKLFGSRVLHIELQSGRMDGNVKKCKYYISDKKIYAKRFGSDCMAGVFESRGALNLVGLDDMRTYADYIATQDELLYQNSYTQRELQKYKGVQDNMAKNDMKTVQKQLGSTVEFLIAVQNGNVQISDEASKATQTLLKELCNTVSDWAGETPSSEEETA